MFYSLTFSYVVDGQRVPLTDENGEVTKVIEAPTKTASMTDSTIQKFCADNGNDTRVRRVI